MIQSLFNSSCAALQYETGTKFSIEQFQSYMTLKITKFQYNHVVLSIYVMYIIEVFIEYLNESRSKERRAHYEAPSF
jgi:hypothetical protein